jgi:hypothetical protein
MHYARPVAFQGITAREAPHHVGCEVDIGMTHHVVGKGMCAGFFNFNVQ